MGPYIENEYTGYYEDSREFNEILANAFNWMGLGLLITALVSFVVASNPSLVKALLGSAMIWVLFIAEIGLVMFLSAKIMSLNPSTSLSLFFIYSALNGITISAIFFVYTKASIASTFIITAVMFMVMAYIGKNTNKDLSKMGSIMFMALIGIIIASLINLFLRSPFIYWMTTYIGVIVFCGLTAWDIQKIRLLSYKMPYQQVAILGALTLYIDFINLFLYLLRIFGDRKR